MELKCKQNFADNLENYDEDAVKDYYDDNINSFDNDDEAYEANASKKDDVPVISYRSIGIQTESPFMVDKAIQASIPRVKNSSCIEKSVITSQRKSPINGLGLMPYIVYGKSNGYYESPLDRVEFDQDERGISKVTTPNNENSHKLVGAAKRKQRSFYNEPFISKKFVADESYKNQETELNDLRIGLISFNDTTTAMDTETNQTMVNRSNDPTDEGLEIDDLYIFTHHPTGLGYQIFNERRSINKEMMEQVFASVIGREDKFYLCLYPPHNGTCHSHAGKSTKIRVVKNHLTSHLFLYRCRLCGRTYKYYNNLFNHFNKHP